MVLAEDRPALTDRPLIRPLATFSHGGEKAKELLPHSRLRKLDPVPRPGPTFPHHPATTTVSTADGSGGQRGGRRPFSGPGVTVPAQLSDGPAHRRHVKHPRAPRRLRLTY